MTLLRVVGSELRKLVTTRMPLAFLAILAVIGVANATAVIWGTDFDGSKDFVSTAADQRSLIAFAANALMIAGLFGAIVAAREYADRSVIPTFLASPRRVRTVVAQLLAVVVGGAAIGAVGAGLTVSTVALSLSTTDYGFLVSAGAVTQVLAASAFAGATGAVIGAGIGAVVRNTGGAVAGAVLALIVAPPLIVQLSSDTSSWVPNTLANTVSGTGSEVSVAAATVALAAWAVVPAAISLVSVRRRDVV